MMSRGAGCHISRPPVPPDRTVFRRSLSADDGLRCGSLGSALGTVDVTWSAFRGLVVSNGSGGRWAAHTVGLWGVSVAAETEEQVDVEGVEVEGAHLVEAFGGPGVGQGLGELVAPVLVLGLQGLEFG